MSPRVLCDAKEKKIWIKFIILLETGDCYDNVTTLIWWMNEWPFDHDIYTTSNMSSALGYKSRRYIFS